MESTKPNKHGKGEGSHYFRESDQRWCATLTLPPIDGKRRRVTRTARTETEAKKILTELRRERLKTGDIPTAAQTLSSWLDYWFTNIALKTLRPKTAATWRSTIETHIKPSIGRVQLVKLSPEHVRRLASSIEDKGLSASTALLAHRVLGVAMKYALREGRVTRNVVDLVDAPRKAATNLAVLSAADGIKVLESVTDSRLGSRWAAALLTGARQGELLGLELDRVGDDLDLSWQLQRFSWEHGCGNQCGEKRGASCPDRKVTFPRGSENRYLEGGLWLSRPKSKTGQRIIPLVSPLREIIERRVDAASLEPNRFGLLWTADPKKDRHGRIQELDGSPIDPSQDNAAWHEILKRAGVPDARLHDARHTTASLLLEAGVPEALIMKILGHNSYAVTRAYQSVDRRQLSDAMSRMSALMPLAPKPPQ